jgi:hypothetical protein
MIAKYDDMLGVISSAAGGGTAWNFAALGDTGFLMGKLRTSGDIVQLRIQVPHRRKLGSNLSSIHLHVVLETAINENETVVLDQMSYVWLKVGDAIPASASWTSISNFTFTAPAGGHAAQTYLLWNIATNVAPPSNEGYGGMLLVKIRRTTGTTYTGELGILDVDAHSPMDRMGSILDHTDA